MKYLIMVFALFVAGSSFAQTLNGIVLDTNGLPLEDVGVFNKTNGEHNHTNLNGEFILSNTKVNDTVYFSRLGKRTLTLPISNTDLQKQITIQLEDASINLDQVVLVSQVDALSKLVAVDLELTPVQSSQEILRKVPGLIIGQHAGGGKAEQIFLRGFDIDHGTDIALNVDGMPVNMVSHAHGQGYADLHFIIPETIENLDFGKGPFYAEQGNFATAGYVDLNLKKELDNSTVSIEHGLFDTNRFTGLFGILDSGDNSAYLASELFLTNGPVESPQNFNRLNILGRYRYYVPGDQELLLTASHFQSKWDASGQIPQRAVDQGLISRFGAIDDTEGGNTSRTNISINHTKTVNSNSSVHTNVYATHYNFELFSNFTFFLEDPENGDQIRQFEDRILIGAHTHFKNNSAKIGNTNFSYKTGAGFRFDQVKDNELSRTKNRVELLERLAFGDVDETNMFGYAEARFDTGKFSFNPVLRLDYFKFDYVDKLSVVYNNRSESKVTFSPKFNTIFNASKNTQFFLKTGIGFHSNDTRVVVANGGEQVLPAAYGLDFGTIVKPISNMVLNATVWSLFLDQEFVYVGDAGIVEPSGKTRRYGMELGVRYQPKDWFYLYADANLTNARSTENTDGQDFIPLAPDFTSVGGFTVDLKNGFSGGLNYRFIDDRPANEDNSIVAEGYFVNDVNVNYTKDHWRFSLIVENVFDVDWNETQFATESRLLNEADSFEEIHFTPGTPFFLRGKVTLTL